MAEKLYLTDSYLTEFEALVMEVREGDEGRAVILDRTCFYPEGGGQPCDRGRLEGAAVLKVTEVEGEVYHFVDEDFATVEGAIKGSVDWGRRFDHMQQHTGQHLLSQAFLQTMGCETLSFHLGSEYSTINLKSHSLTPEAIYSAEDMANRIICQNRQIKCYHPQGGSLDATAVRGVPSETDRPRLVEVSDFDRSYCGGTHCRATGEVGLVKVRRWERHRGRARVEFLCGFRALKDYRAKNRWLYEITRELGVSGGEAGERVKKHLEENRELRSRLNRATEALLEMEALSLTGEARAVAGLKVILRVFRNREVKEVKLLAEKLTSESAVVALLGVAADSAALIFSCSRGLGIDMRELMALASPLVGGKGGGGPAFAQGGGPKVERLQEALEKAEEALTERIEA
jgi:alanyl-tRNA synthetase